MITTLTTVPFLTEGIEGCTEFFKEVEIVAFDPVSISDLTGPETFVGIANVVVLVTSPFAFVVTPGRKVVDGDGRALAEADCVGAGLAVGVALAPKVGIGVGVATAKGEGDGEGEIEGVGPGPPPPNPPPPEPPPPPELPPGSDETAIIEKDLVTEVAAA